jgi:hypothetical protein
MAGSAAARASDAKPESTNRAAQNMRVMGRLRFWVEARAIIHTAAELPVVDRSAA